MAVTSISTPSVGETILQAESIQPTATTNRLTGRSGVVKKPEAQAIRRVGGNEDIFQYSQGDVIVPSAEGLAEAPGFQNGVMFAQADTGAVIGVTAGDVAGASAAAGITTTGILAGVAVATLGVTAVANGGGGGGVTPVPAINAFTRAKVDAAAASLSASKAAVAADEAATAAAVKAATSLALANAAAADDAAARSAYATANADAAAAVTAQATAALSDAAALTLVSNADAAAAVTAQAAADADPIYVLLATAVIWSAAGRESSQELVLGMVSPAAFAFLGIGKNASAISIFTRPGFYRSSQRQ